MFRKIAFKIAKPVAGGRSGKSERRRKEKRCSETWCSCKERTKEK